MAAVYKHIPLRVGQWIGFAACTATRVGICAVTYDDAIVDPAAIAADFAALRAAPVAEVFDPQASLDDAVNTWARRGAMETALESSLIDTARLDAAGKKVRYVFQEVARTLLVYQRLGRLFLPIALDSQVNVIAAPARAAFADILTEHGWGSKIPAPTSTLRAAYRALIEDPLADFGINSGRWHLGRPEANLGGPIQ